MAALVGHDHLDWRHSLRGLLDNFRHHLKLSEAAHEFVRSFAAFFKKRCGANSGANSFTLDVYVCGAVNDSDPYSPCSGELLPAEVSPS
jgi:hypothetical protein